MPDILTGYEIYEKDSDKIHIPMSIDHIEVCMRDRDPEKYGDFDKVLAQVELTLKLMCIPEYKKRARLFDLVYHAMRFIDDVVDGDTNPPLSLENRTSLVHSVIQPNIDEIKNPLYREMMSEIQKISQELGVYDEMMKGIHEIIISMNFDLERILDTHKFRVKNDLETNFHKMDIVGTIAGTAIIFGIEPKEAIPLITPLGEACRVMYNLRDFGEDICADLINIPLEDIQDFRIYDEYFEQIKEQGKNIDYNELPDSIKKWMRKEIRKIDMLLGAHKKNMQHNISFADSKPLLKWYRNIILKNQVFPKAYTNEIHQRIPKILSEIGDNGMTLKNINV